MPEPVAVLLAGVSPPDVACAVEPVRRRDDEHLAGRRAAARAVDALQGAGEVSGSRGARPSWPPGLIGSISHTQGWAAAVVSRTDHHGAIGLDLEVSGALPAEDAVGVCSAVERSVLAGLAVGPRRDAAATLHWVGKEAAFKAWDAWCAGALQGVDPTWLAVDFGTDGQVHARPARELAGRVPGLPLLSGRWAGAVGLVAVVLAAPPRPPAGAATECDTVQRNRTYDRGGPRR